MRFEQHDFELKILPSNKFRIETFIACQIVTLGSNKVSGFEVNFLQSVRLWIKNFTTSKNSI